MNWHNRTGQTWYEKVRQRGRYRTWPWVNNRDDPLRFHREPSQRRFSAADGTASSSNVTPIWDVYAEVGRHYRGVDDTRPVTWLTTFLKPYVGKVWNSPSIDALLHSVALVAPTIASVNAFRDRGGLSQAWQDERIRRAASVAAPLPRVPESFLQHVDLLCRDIGQQSVLKQRSTAEHDSGRQLMLPDTTSYFVVPRPTAPARSARPWSETFDGVYRIGKYCTMQGVKFHTLHVPDRQTKFNFRPA